MKKFRITLLLTLILFIGAGCSFTKDVTPLAPEYSQGNEVNELNDVEKIVIEDNEIMQDNVLQNRFVFTSLLDSEVQGEGYYGTKNGETRIYTSFILPITSAVSSYQGWLICNDTYFTTGVLTFFDGVYENTFVSSDVPLGCEAYIVTLEPHDGDPSPSRTTVIEGRVEGIASTIDWDDSRFTNNLVDLPISYICSDNYEFNMAKDSKQADTIYMVPLESGISITLKRTSLNFGQRFSTADNTTSILFEEENITILGENDSIMHQDCLPL